MSEWHRPVLLNEAMQALAIKPDGVYVDATFGRGGHSSKLLDQLGTKGRLLAIDKDPQAIAEAQRLEWFTDKRFLLEQGSFTMLQRWLTSLGLSGQINGILLDLGVSSPQLDAGERGFSFLREGPLDMRMDPSTGISAAQWIKKAPVSEIAQVLKTFGEERYARRIASAIVRERVNETITTTTQLASIIRDAHPKWERHKHPATRSFQAIRIFINHELDELKDVLTQCMDALAEKGRLVVISFHSLEDRIVKRFIQEQMRGGDFPEGLPLTHDQMPPKLRRIGAAIRPSATEIDDNPRARSAVMRVAEKLA